MQDALLRNSDTFRNFDSEPQAIRVDRERHVETKLLLLNQNLVFNILLELGW